MAASHTEPIVIEEPPPVQAPRKGIPLWVFGCLGGCLLAILVPVGCGAFVFFQGKRMIEEAQDPMVQQQTYEAIVPNTGPPPGYKIALGSKVPFVDVRFVVFAGDSAGSVEQALESARYLPILVRAPEDERDRSNREKLFDPQGSGQPDVPAFFQFLPDVQNQKHAFQDRTVGTIPGHRFPLRYFIANVKDRRRGEQPMAMVDLTTPSMVKEAVQLIVISPRGEEITAALLEDLCRNFKPGE